MFALACLDQANKIVPVPKPKDWKQHFLKPMMQLTRSRTIRVFRSY